MLFKLHSHPVPFYIPSVSHVTDFNNISYNVNTKKSIKTEIKLVHRSCRSTRKSTTIYPSKSNKLLSYLFVQLKLSITPVKAENPSIKWCYW